MAAREALYEPNDEIDEQPFAPNFGMLIYPWRIEDENKQLKPMMRVHQDTPPTFIVSTYDDLGTISTGAAKLYIDLKENNVDAELHIYHSGGTVTEPDREKAASSTNGQMLPPIGCDCTVS